MTKKTPEDKAKDEVKAVIKEVCAARGLKYRIDWHAGSAFESTLDGTGVIAGHPFICEIKRFDENEQPTARQKIHMQDYNDAGAKVFDLIDRTALHALRYWLETLEPREPHDP
jgi:hypothetical protein